MIEGVSFKNTNSGLDKVFDDIGVKNYQEIKQIPISKILINPLNEMNDDFETIKIFAENIYSTPQGVLDIIVVYPNVDDTYTLLSGERRLRASQYNLTIYMDAPKTLLAKIVNPPKDQIEELDLLLAYNEYRRFETDQEKIKHVEKYKKLYELKTANGERLGKKREWIAKRSGIGIGKVGKIIQYLDGKRNDVSTVSEKKKTASNDLSYALEDILHTKVRVSNSKLTIYFDEKITCNDVLKDLGLLDKLHEQGF